MSGDTIKHVFALIEQKHQESNISKDLIEEATLKLPTQIRVVYKKSSNQPHSEIIKMQLTVSLFK